MKRVILILFCISFFLNTYTQQSIQQIRHFSAREYGKGHEAANWACVQDSNGILYFGNAGGLLQYDGDNWNFIPVKRHQVWVKALAVSENNVIYVGAQNEFGYLAPDKQGALSYVSLSDKFDSSENKSTSISRVWAWKNQVAFQAEDAIYLYTDHVLSVIKPETSFHLSFLVNDELFVRQRGIGLMKLSGNDLQFVEGSEFFKDLGISAILQSSVPENLIIITREDGIWIADKSTFQATAIKTNSPDLFKKSDFYGAIKLPDGRIVMNTLSNGILFTDEDFNILSHIKKDNGLKVNGVLSLMYDYQGNLWAGLDNGIAQIHDSSPLSIYGTETGISGNIKAITRYKSKLFIGTTEGLFVQQDEPGRSLSVFALKPGFSKEIRSLCLAFGTLYAGTQDGLFEINDKGVKSIEKGVFSDLYFSEKLNILFAAEKNGLIIYKTSGNQMVRFVIPEISEEIISIQEDTSSVEHTLWMGTQLRGIMRLKFKNLPDYKVDRYYSFEDGLVNNAWIFPLKINGEMFFSQQRGLLQFVDEETLKKALPDSLKDRPEFSRGYFEFDVLKEHQGPVYVLEDSPDRIYANLDNELGYYDKANGLTWNTHPFSLCDVGKVNVIFHEGNGLCWIGGDDGLIRFDEMKFKDYQLAFKTILSQVSCSTDSVLFSGYGGVQTGIGPVLDYAFNTLSFHFSAPFFEGQEKILFSVFLEGQDSAYGTWQPDTKVVFSNLREGEYRFKVRAKNAYDQVSSESYFSFEIASPWYRSIWAFICYFLLFIGFSYLAIRINSQRLIAKNKKLEEIILERTQEIKQKNIVLEHQKEEILDSINYALRIQKAVLPDDELTKKWLGEHFILFRPKDIVSGDFYWISKYDKHVFFCVADCTGHGVPGAFMSMLCISFLNEVVLKDKVTDSGEICNRLREMIIESLKQKGVSGEQKDGMDITLCVLNTQTLELQYSGANNPLYIVRSKDQEAINSDKQQESVNHILYEIKADSMPIAIHIKMDPFKKHSFNLQKGDKLFLFSDGIADQFGGPSGKKFMYKAFKTALLEDCDLEMGNQKRLLEKRIDEWMSFTDPPFEQIDDICLMGVKI